MGKWFETIENIQDKLNSEITQYDLTYKDDDDDTVYIWTTSQFANTLDYHFSNRRFLVPDSIEKTDDERIYAYFKQQYQAWHAYNAANIIRAFKALALEYEPLDNYNGIEERTTEYGKTLKIEYGKTDTTTYGRTDTTESNIFGYNSGATGAPSDKIINTLGNSDSVAGSGEDNHTDGGTDKETLLKHGNLGVTTSQQMLESEYELRCRAFIFDTIKRFIDAVTVY